LTDVDAPGAFTDFRAQIAVGTVSGNITLQARNGAVFNDLATLSDSTTYSVWMITNNVTDKFDVYLQGGAFATQTQVGAGLDFRTATTNTLDRYFGLEAASSGTVFLDDIYVTPGVALDDPYTRLTQEALADTYMHRSGTTTTHGNEADLLVKDDSGTVRPNDRVAVLRFNNPLLGDYAQGAKLLLDPVAIGGTFTFRVEGILETEGDEDFSEHALTPSNSSLFASGVEEMIDLAGVVNLGDITLSSADNGTTVEFTSQALIDFINADTNGYLSFVLRRLSDDAATSTFASREHATLNPPRLQLQIPEPRTMICWVLLAATLMPWAWKFGKHHGARPAA
jgi:hypothetical protein